MIKLPKDKEVLGIGLIRHSSLGGPRLLYYGFDHKLHYVRRKSLPRLLRYAIFAVMENELVLIDTEDDLLIHKYSPAEIKILHKKGCLKILSKILKEKEQLKKKMFDKEKIEESAKTKIDIAKIIKNEA